MAVTLTQIPVSNTCNYRVALMLGGNILASIDAGEATVLSNLVFDQIGLYNPPNPPVIRTQNPNVPITVGVGSVAYVSCSGGTTFHYAAPNGPDNTVTFT
jgi:hypothetical protein